MSVVDQFKGLPMDALIGGPLKAACDANLMMAEATSSYINDVGFTKDENGIPKDPRMIDFSFERPGEDSEGKPTIDLVKIKLPVLAIVPIPNLQVNNVDVTFDMEVKSSTSSTEKDAKEIGGELSATVGGGWGSASVKISGSVSSSKENTRSSDTSAKYHVEVNARNFGTPEGLARVLDMMNQAAQPRQIEQYQTGENGEKTGDPKLIDKNGKALEAGTTNSTDSTAEDSTDDTTEAPE